MMVFSPANHCAESTDNFLKTFYTIFVVFTVVGYAQFVLCIVLLCMLPLILLIIYRLVQYRLNRGNHAEDEELLGGLLRVPVPIPEILSQLTRIKFRTGSFQLANQCSICWLDFTDEQEVTPLLCDERHLFHTKCIELWIRKGHNSCPLCRKQIANL